MKKPTGHLIALTGFMGVGKSSVSRHLARRLKLQRLDLDIEIERAHDRKIADLIDNEGIEKYRDIETDALRNVLERNSSILLSLGGGTFTLARNREMLTDHGFTTIWLEATFDHCWGNIARSRKDRPLARDRARALQLFEERQSIYCLADWHFLIRPGLSSHDIAEQIADELC